MISDDGKRTPQPAGVSHSDVSGHVNQLRHRLLTGWLEYRENLLQDFLPPEH